MNIFHFLAFYLTLCHLTSSQCFLQIVPPLLHTIILLKFQILVIALYVLYFYLYYQ